MAALPCCPHVPLPASFLASLASPLPSLPHPRSPTAPTPQVCPHLRLRRPAVRPPDLLPAADVGGQVARARVQARLDERRPMARRDGGGWRGAGGPAGGDGRRAGTGHGQLGSRGARGARARGRRRWPGVQRRQLCCPAFHPTMQTPHMRAEHWRKSNQFFGLTRRHAELVVADTEAERSCVALGWPPRRRDRCVDCCALLYASCTQTCRPPVCLPAASAPHTGSETSAAAGTHT